MPYETYESAFGLYEVHARANNTTKQTLSCITDTHPHPQFINAFVTKSTWEPLLCMIIDQSNHSLKFIFPT